MPKPSAGLAPLQQKLQQHIDREDRRIKELTEAILYEFLPAALRVLAPEGSDPGLELTPAKCRAVACAALAVATLMNAPPGFLEFLLCVPWTDLGALYSLTGGGSDLVDFGPAAGLGFDCGVDFDLTTAEGLTAALEEAEAELLAAAGPAAMPPAVPPQPLVPELRVSSEERTELVNLRLDPALMDCLLDFLYREEYQESLPPMIRLAEPADAALRGLGGEAGADGGGGGCEDISCGGPWVTREVVAALLDGATPLHCAAIRGNPAQVDHLLMCGADPLAPNAAGERHRPSGGGRRCQRARLPGCAPGLMLTEVGAQGCCLPAGTWLHHPLGCHTSAVTLGPSTLPRLPRDCTPRRWQPPPQASCRWRLCRCAATAALATASCPAAAWAPGTRRPGSAAPAWPAR